MYFDACETLEQLRAEYKRLALKNHPDLGGNTRIMQDINAEFERVFNRLKRTYNAEQAERGKPQTTETPDEYRAIIDKLIVIEGITVELCGSWLWISGDTYTHKDELKAAGCRWSHTKKLWYWHHANDNCVWSNGNATMDDIRAKYGSQILTGKTRVKLSA